LQDVTVPGCLLGRAEGLVTTDITIRDGRIGQGPATLVPMRGAMLFPAFVDSHTHLDKGHIWRRTPNPDGTFDGALTAVRAEAPMYWTTEDLRARMEFSLRCAYAHGTGAIRTHLDSFPPQDAISWSLFTDIRAEWAGRIALQASCLVGCDMVGSDDFTRVADRVADHQGVLGLFTYPMPDFDARAERFFRMAMDRGLDTDFHADETMDPTVNTLAQIAQAKLATGDQGRTVAGHTCSLSVMAEDEALRTLDLVARAGIGIISLPMCNLYLQDRHRGRTPRNRGVTLVHEMRERGIPVAFASDNTRDPFYAYGDLDMVEVMREATRICHLDHADPHWSDAFLTAPAAMTGLPAPSLAPGAPADLVICNARDWSELFARPQSDRIVLRAGRQIDRRLPDYRDLDTILSKAPRT
jgi:cytosine/creatinine deaminase